MTIELIEPETATEPQDIAEIRDGAAVVRLNRTEAGLLQQRAESARLEALAVANRAALAAAAPEPLTRLQAAEVVTRVHAAPANPSPAEPATLTLGMICERLHFTVRADFLADVLHIAPAKVEGKRPGTYTESQFQTICRQLQSHVSAMGELYSPEKAA